MATGGADQHLRNRTAGVQTIQVVPLTARSRTADGADIRLLLEARLTSHRLSAEEIERLALALIVPAAVQWLGRQDLAALDVALRPTLPEIESAVREPLAALGTELLAVALVAGEHLLVSPSRDGFDGPG